MDLVVAAGKGEGGVSDVGHLMMTGVHFHIPPLKVVWGWPDGEELPESALTWPVSAIACSYPFISFMTRSQRERD